jgi:hypothetical protein
MVHGRRARGFRLRPFVPSKPGGLAGSLSRLNPAAARSVQKDVQTFRMEFAMTRRAIRHRLSALTGAAVSLALLGQAAAGDRRQTPMVHPSQLQWAATISALGSSGVSPRTSLRKILRNNRRHLETGVGSRTTAAESELPARFRPCGRPGLTRLRPEAVADKPSAGEGRGDPVTPAEASTAAWVTGFPLARGMTSKLSPTPSRLLKKAGVAP